MPTPLEQMALWYGEPANRELISAGMGLLGRALQTAIGQAGLDEAQRKAALLAAIEREARDAQAGLAIVDASIADMDRRVAAMVADLQPEAVARPDALPGSCPSCSPHAAHQGLCHGRDEDGLRCRCVA